MKILVIILFILIIALSVFMTWFLPGDAYVSEANENKICFSYRLSMEWTTRRFCFVNESNPK